jgi:glutaredoxin
MKILIYSLVGCPYSNKAIQILKAYGINHSIVRVKNNDKKEEIKRELKVDTFPQIYIQKDTKNKQRNISIGGCSDLENYMDILHFVKENRMSLTKLNEFNRLVNQSKI